MPVIRTETNEQVSKMIFSSGPQPREEGTGCLSWKGNLFRCTFMMEHGGGAGGGGGEGGSK